MGRKTYTYRTTSFVVGSLILLFLLLLALSFVGGYYAGESEGRREVMTGTRVKKSLYPEKVEEKEIKTPPVPSPVKNNPSPKTESTENNTIKSTSSLPKKTPAPEKPSPPKSSGEYYLQVVALRNYRSAKGLASALEKNGFPAAIEQARGFYRVLVGPYNLNEAKAVREKIFPVLKKLRVRLRSAREILIRRKR